MWAKCINHLKPTGYFMYHQLLTTKVPLSAHTVYLCVSYGSQNSDYFPIQHYLIGFYNKVCVYCEVGTESLYIYFIFSS